MKHNEFLIFNFADVYWKVCKENVHNLYTIIHLKLCKKNSSFLIRNATYLSILCKLFFLISERRVFKRYWLALSHIEETGISLYYSLSFFYFLLSLLSVSLLSFSLSIFSYFFLCFYVLFSLSTLRFNLFSFYE